MAARAELIRNSRSQAVSDRHLQAQRASDVIVCSCAQVTEAEIRASIDRNGASSLDDVMQQTGAGQACHGCHYRIRRMLAGQSPFCGPISVSGSQPAFAGATAWQPEPGDAQSQCACRSSNANAAGNK